VEHGEAVPDEKLNELAGEIADDMSQKIKVRPKIIWVKPGVLERSTYKGKVFEKQYENK
jgi:hypothetical protein